MATRDVTHQYLCFRNALKSLHDYTKPSPSGAATSTSTNANIEKRSLLQGTQSGSSTGVEGDNFVNIPLGATSIGTGMDGSSRRRDSSSDREEGTSRPTLLGKAGAKDASDPRSTPADEEWVVLVGKMKDLDTLLRSRLSMLRELHSTHLRPQLKADEASQEQAITALTQEVQGLFKQGERILKSVALLIYTNQNAPAAASDAKAATATATAAAAACFSADRQRLLLNVQASVGRQLGELSQAFRAEQRRYLTELSKQKERTRKLSTFGSTTTSPGGGGATATSSKPSTVTQSLLALLPASARPALAPPVVTACAAATTSNISGPFVDDPQADSLTPLSDEQMDRYLAQGYSLAQVEALRANQDIAATRDKEIQEIYKTLVELHEIFRDIHTLVFDQGTLLDRIDYNVEETRTQVVQGNVQLQQTIVSQRRGWFLQLTLLLVTLIAVMTLLLLFKLTK